VTDTLERLQTALGDRYRVERELGAGGMATVFLAQDVKHDREVAIKVLHPELAASIGSERFDREIRLAAKLQHPHILGLYDSGAANGLLYYVMPFVKGESLRDRLNREQQLPIDDAIQIAVEVADALGYAHEHGVVHRDIKPENILLSGGHALVADFGIARAAASADTQKLTQTGVAIGTPLYMSPEQSVGENVGPTADIYSLGCVLYEMLSGSPPFTGPNARAIMARHAMTPVPGLQEVRASVPDEIEDAVMAALAKVPADRPQTAKQFCEIMGTPLGATSTRRAGVRMTGTRHPSVRMTAQQLAATRELAAYAPLPFWQRRWVWAAATMLLVAGGAVAWVVSRGRSAPGADAGGLDRHTIAVLYFEDQSPKHDLGYVADGFTEALIDQLSQVPGLNVISKGGAGAWRDSSLAPDSIARALQAGTLVQGRVEPTEGDRIRVQIWLVDGNSGADLGKRASFERPESDLVGARDSLAAQAADLIRQQLGQEVNLRGQQEGTRSTAAWSLVQRAELLRKSGEAAAEKGDTLAFQRAFQASDSLLAQAERLDPKWADPIVARSRLAYLRSRHYLSDPIAAGKWIQMGLGHAGRALAISGNNADALELRGNLQYWKYLLRLEQDPAAATALRNKARNDLEQATRLRPTQAGAWASLSHLYGNDPNASQTDVVLAARRAYESDAYLANAPKIVERLFYASYDLDQSVDAAHWCDEGKRRFPNEPAFTTCQLYLMTMRGQNADPAKAWQLAQSEALSKELVGGSPEFQQAEARIMVACVLARAGLKDSARAVARSSLVSSEVDPTRFLYLQEAFALVLADDKPGAVQALKVFLAANPERRNEFTPDPGWRFRSLATDPAFQALVGAQ
jgi:TolB-like protein